MGERNDTLPSRRAALLALVLHVGVRYSRSFSLCAKGPCFKLRNSPYWPAGMRRPFGTPCPSHAGRCTTLLAIGKHSKSNLVFHGRTWQHECHKSRATGYMHWFSTNLTTYRSRLLGCIRSIVHSCDRPANKLTLRANFADVTRFICSCVQRRKRK